MDTPSTLTAGIACGWVVLLLAAAGCSDGTVVAKGHVMIEGKPAAGGRLSLSPVGGGPRAFSAVDKNGEFALRTATGAEGAFAGSYRVFFRTPLDAEARKIVSRELAGELAVDELTLSYRGPSDEPLVIPDSGDEDLIVNIRLGHGWTRHLIE